MYNIIDFGVWDDTAEGALTMSDSIRLLAKAERAIATGKLPSDIQARIWGGSGSGRPCSLCEEPLQPDQLEFELETGDLGDVRFHMDCHRLWENACRELKRETGAAA